MKERKCISPRKASAVMKRFINNASDLTYKRGTIPFDKAWQTEDGEWHWNDEDITWESAKKEMRVKHIPESFCAAIMPTESSEDAAFGYILYDFNRLYGAQQFCNHWRRINPMLKGFADITLILLHELGHWETNDEIRKVFSADDRISMMDNLRAIYSIQFDDGLFVDEISMNEEYFEMPDERAASMWGFNWLSNAENRKIAKAFEKEFFACFAK